jgi:hypothetical protein
VAIATRPDTPLKDHPANLLAAVGAGAIILAATLWIAQCSPRTRISQSALASACGWLVAAGWCALRIWVLSPRAARLSHDLASGAPVGRTRYDTAVGRRPVYLACGRVATATCSMVVLADVALAVGAVHLRDVNLFLFTWISLGVTSECASIRALGPQNAAADLAYRQAARAAGIARDAC